jgi:hypothetical protein
VMKTRDTRQFKRTALASGGDPDASATLNCWTCLLLGG